MTHNDFARAYRLSLGRPATRDACPSPDELLAAVERRAPDQARLRVLNHALDCHACAEELELLRAIQRTRPASFSNPRVLALAALVVLVIGLGYWRLTSTTGGSLRSGAEPITLVAPLGGIAARPTTLIWRAVSNASRYAVEVRREDGTLVLNETTTDTTFTLPAQLALAPGADFYWTVSARLGDGSELRAAPRRFAIQRP